MKPKTLIFLVVVLTICALYIVARNVNWPFGAKAPETSKPKAESVFETTPGEAVEARVVADDGETLAFEKTGEQWWIVEPVRAPAVGYAVADVTDAMHFLRAERSYAPEDDLAPGPELTGLDQPLWVVTLRDAEGQTYTLRVGRPVPATDSQTYVQPEGSDRVYVVGVDFASTLSRPPAEYRSRDVLDVAGGDVDRIAVAGRESFTLVRSGEKTWRLTEPTSAPADADRAEKLARRLANLQVAEFVSSDTADLAAYGLAEPLLTVTVAARPAEAASAETQAAETEPATAPAENVWRIAFGGRTADRVYARVV